MGLLDWFKRGRSEDTVHVTLIGGSHELRIELPSFVQCVKGNRRVRMDAEGGGYWHLFRTDETDNRYDDRGSIDIGFADEDKPPDQWCAIRRRYGEDVPGESPGSFRCPLGEAYFIVRGGYAAGPKGRGFLVPEWLGYYIYVPGALMTCSIMVAYVGSRTLFLQGRRAAVESIVKSMKS